MTQNGVICDDQVDVVPGRSFGRFVLGTSLVDVVPILKDTRSYGIIQVRGASFPTRTGSSITLVSGKRRAFFKFSASQLLERIVLEDTGSFGDILYKGELLCSSSRPPTFMQVYDVLGPTLPGTFNSVNDYILSYPGLQLSFNIPSQYCNEFVAGGKHPTMFPNGVVPVAHRIEICPYGLEAPVSRGVSDRREFGFIVSGDTVRYAPHSQRFEFVDSQVSVPLGCSPQQLMSLLGAVPHRIFNHEDSRMSIHNPRLVQAQTTSREYLLPPSYSMNYPKLGMDFVFSSSHQLQKVMLFNPMQYHESYLRYHCCRYEVCVEDKESTFVVDNGTRWDEIPFARTSPPMLSSVGCSNGLVLRIFSFQRFVFYVMSNEYIVKILVISESDRISGNDEQTSPLESAVEVKPPRSTNGDDPIDVVHPLTRSSRFVDPVTDKVTVGNSLVDEVIFVEDEAQTANAEVALREEQGAAVDDSSIAPASQTVEKRDKKPSKKKKK